MKHTIKDPNLKMTDIRCFHIGLVYTCHTFTQLILLGGGGHSLTLTVNDLFSNVRY